MDTKHRGLVNLGERDCDKKISDIISYFFLTESSTILIYRHIVCIMSVCVVCHQWSRDVSLVESSVNYTDRQRESL